MGESLDELWDKFKREAKGDRRKFDANAARERREIEEAARELEKGPELERLEKRVVQLLIQRDNLRKERGNYSEQEFNMKCEEIKNELHETRQRITYYYYPNSVYGKPPVRAGLTTGTRYDEVAVIKEHITDIDNRIRGIIERNPHHIMSDDISNLSRLLEERRDFERQLHLAYEHSGSSDSDARLDTNNKAIWHALSRLTDMLE